MTNPYQTQSYILTEIRDETQIIKRFILMPEHGHRLEYAPGQIVFVSMPGFGEAPFAPCGGPNAEYLELCIRKAGRFTEKIHSMKEGERVGVRGPYGNGWLSSSDRHCEAKSRSNPDDQLQTTGSPRPASETRDDKNRKNLLLVVGGLGLVPLRTLILGKDKFLGKDAKIHIFYGAKHPSEMLFKDDYETWRKNGVELRLTIDKECPEWSGCVGVVTVLFDRHELVENANAFLVGPPIMYKFVLQKLKEKNLPEKDIYLSLERRMHCGIGVCQHCAVGSLYTCKDGPVFPYEKIKDIEGAI